MNDVSSGGDNARTAIVVGGAGGIGGAVCRRLASDGLTVALLDRDAERSETVLRTLDGPGHFTLAADVTDEDAIDAAFEQVEARSAAAVLVIIAGGPLGHPAQPPSIAAATLDEWQRTLTLNVTGTFLCMRKFTRLRAARPLDHGRIVSFASITGQIGATPTGPSYASSKAAVMGLTRNVAAELAPTGMTVNAVAPGAVGTEEFYRLVNGGMVDAIRRAVPLQRIGTPEEIAAAVAFLVSEQASYLTGTTLDVNGGVLMR